MIVVIDFDIFCLSPQMAERPVVNEMTAGWDVQKLDSLGCEISVTTFKRYEPD
jgi:hypothetical protein